MKIVSSLDCGGAHHIVCRPAVALSNQQSESHVNRRESEWNRVTRPAAPGVTTKSPCTRGLTTIQKRDRSMILMLSSTATWAIILLYGHSRDRAHSRVWWHVISLFDNDARINSNHIVLFLGNLLHKGPITCRSSSILPRVQDQVGWLGSTNCYVSRNDKEIIYD